MSNTAPVTPELWVVLEDVALERKRQIEMGYTPEHDSSQVLSDMSALAKDYLYLAQHAARTNNEERDRVVQAIALLVAAVETLDRKRTRGYAEPLVEPAPKVVTCPVCGTSWDDSLGVASCPSCLDVALGLTTARDRASLPKCTVCARTGLAGNHTARTDNPGTEKGLHPFQPMPPTGAGQADDAAKFYGTEGR